MNIAVFCSGNGSNLQAIIDAKNRVYLKADIRVVVSDVPGCYALTRAEKAGTGYQTMMNEALREYLSESDHPVTEKALRQILRQEMPEYLRGLTPSTTATARKRAR